MKRLLLPLLAALALPTAVMAETYYLILGGFDKDIKAGGITNMPMTTMEECEVAGKKVMESNMHEGTSFYHMRYVCVKGK